MPYKSFREIAGESGSVNSSYQREYSKTWIIEVDSPTDSPFYVGSHPQLPLIYSSYPADPMAYCVSLSPSQNSSNPLIWTVVARYAYTLDAVGGSGGGWGTGVPAIDAQQQGKPPAERKTVPDQRGNDYSWTTQSLRRVVVKEDTFEKLRDGSAEDGKPLQFVNSAGDELSNLPEVDIYGIQVQIGRNLPGAPNTDWLKINGKLNANKCQIGHLTCEIATARMMHTSAELVYENNTSYWRWNHEILIVTDPKEWQFTGVSRGWNALIPVSKTPGGPTVDAKVRIGLHHRELADQPQILASTGHVWSLDKTRVKGRFAYNYIERAIFPAVL